MSAGTRQPGPRSVRDPWFALAPLLAVLLACTPASRTPASRDFDDAALRALLDPARPDHLVGLQVAVVVDGELWQRAYGRRFVHPTDRAQDLPLTTDSLLRAASASKPVAAILVMQLVERGVVGLDADVSGYLGFTLRNPRFPATPITLRMLLSHTSSVADGGGYRLPVEARIESLFTPGSAEWDGGSRFNAHAPGSWFEYSNLGWGLLGTVIERATGERFDRVAAREVLMPLGLGGGFDVAGLDASERARLAVTYRKGDEDAPSWDPTGPWLAQNDDPRPPEAGGSGRWYAPGADPRIGGYAPGANATLFSPQGGLRISAGGLARLWSCLLAERWLVMARLDMTPRAAGDCSGVTAPNSRVLLLTPASRDAMLAPQWSYDPRAPNGDTSGGEFLSWGLGVQRFTGAHAPTEGRLDSPSARLDGRPLVGHLADAYGLFGGVWFTPDGRFGLVYFATGTATPLAANPGARSGLRRWDEQIVDWAAREAWSVD